MALFGRHIYWDVVYILQNAYFSVQINSLKMYHRAKKSLKKRGEMRNENEIRKK